MIAPPISRRSDLTLLILALSAMAPLMLVEDWSDVVSASIAGGVMGLMLICGFSGIAGNPHAPASPARRAAVTALVITSLALVGVELFGRRQIPVIALGHFTMLLAAAKLLDLRAARDRVDVMVISLLSLVMGAMVSANVAFGVVLSLYVIVGGLWVMRFRMVTEAHESWRRQVNRMARTGRGAIMQPPGSPPTQRFPRLWLMTGWHAIIIMAVVIILFIAMPRQIVRRLDFGVTAGLTDYTSQVDLNQIGALLESDQPVMRVRLSRDGVNIADAESWLYLRGNTLTRYVEREWRSGPRGPRLPVIVQPDNQPHSLYDNAESVLGGGQIEQDIWLDQLNEPVLFSLYAPTTIATTDQRTTVQFLARDMTLRLLRAPGRAMHYRVTSPVGRDYRTTEQIVESAVPTIDDTTRGPRDPGFRTGMRRGTDSPQTAAASDISPRLAELARTLTGVTAPAPPERWAAAASAIESHLQSNRYTYSLQARTRIPGRDPLEVFLFETRTGFCQHFASAMTVMCQSLGMDARLVVGYSGGEYNTVGGFYRIRRRDAHAWVEVRLPDRGWTTFDPTPARDPSQRRRTDGLRALLVRWYDFLQFEWASLVVTFDAPHRQELWDAFKRWWSRLAAPAGGARGWIAWLRELVWGPSVFHLSMRILYWIMLLLIVVLGVLLCRAAWIISLIVREHLPQQRRGGNPTRVRRRDARFYDRILVQLARLGHVKPPHQTPGEFAAQLTQCYAPLSRLVEMTHWYYDAEYGAREFDSTRRREIERLLGNLRIYGAFETPGS